MEEDANESVNGHNHNCDTDTAPADTDSPVKRKRSPSKEPTDEKTPLKRPYVDNEDDGETCPVCLDQWELSGSHRLVSLKCGHLFGHSCISRWLKECPRLSRSCPSCKTQAKAGDLRQIYARKVVTVDKSEEYRLAEELTNEKTKVLNMKQEYCGTKMALACQIARTLSLEKELEQIRYNAIKSKIDIPQGRPDEIGIYQIHLEKNVELSKDDGCRVMAYSTTHQTLFCSQHSKQGLFPGHHIRFVDIPTLTPRNSLYVSVKPVRDICLKQLDGTLIATSQDCYAKLFDINSRSLINSVAPGDNSCLWSCAFDKMGANRMLLGNQCGRIFAFDIRSCAKVEASFRPENADNSPVLHICPMGAINGVLPFGGFLVCKLQSFWLYEYKGLGVEVECHSLNVEGPFASLTVSENKDLILISTRPTQKNPIGKLITGQLKRIDRTIVFMDTGLFYGSKLLAKITHNAIINMGQSDDIVATYLQDSKKMVTWNLNSGIKMQSMVMNDTVYDMCPLYLGHNVHLATLTGKKCRLFNIVQSPL